jgi:catechol 2,3-dioxygenase-like lactoylglutathione lyase family enzyme
MEENQTMPAFKPIQVAVITLWAEDVPAAVHFYRDVIGLSLTRHHERQPTFDLHNGTYLVLLKGRLSQVQDINQPLFPQVAFSVESLDDALKQLQRHGVALAADVAEDFGTRWVMFRDPGGNLIEFVQFDKINIR